MRQAQEERKAQLASKNQLEAKYALKFKLKKDKLDRLRRRLVEREEKADAHPVELHKIEFKPEWKLCE